MNFLGKIIKDDKKYILTKFFFFFQLINNHGGGDVVKVQFVFLCSKVSWEKAHMFVFPLSKSL